VFAVKPEVKLLPQGAHQILVVVREIKPVSPAGRRLVHYRVFHAAFEDADRRESGILLRILPALRRRV